jgi:hypothetical protein
MEARVAVSPESHALTGCRERHGVDFLAPNVEYDDRPTGIVMPGLAFQVDREKPGMLACIANAPEQTTMEVPQRSVLRNIVKEISLHGALQAELFSKNAL